MTSPSRETPGSRAGVLARQRRAQADRTALRRPADLGLVALGLFAALGSASFAGYMITTDHSNPQFVGAEHLMLFAQPIRSVAVAPVLFARRVPADPGVDYSPVGSIPEPAAGRDAGRDIRVTSSAPVTGYVLREAHNGIAIVDGPGGSFEVIAGATLPGAGKVVAVEFRAGKWQVVTENGLISARR